MSNVYTTRANFKIARNDELNITLFGMWYRHETMQYVVMPAEGASQWFSNLPNALECFERLTATPLDVTPEEDEAFQALSTAPVSSF